MDAVFAYWFLRILNFFSVVFLNRFGPSAFCLRKQSLREDMSIKEVLVALFLLSQFNHSNRYYWFNKSNRPSV